MNYHDYEIKASQEDLESKNVLYGWVIKMNNKTYTYYGISTRNLKERTQEHIRDKRTPFDKFLTDYKNQIESIEIKVLKQYKRNFKNMKSKLESIETKRIAQGLIEDTFNLNKRQVQQALNLI